MRWSFIESLLTEGSSSPSFRSRSTKKLLLPPLSSHTLGASRTLATSHHSRMSYHATKTRRVYAHRTTRGHRHHCRPNRLVAPRGAESPRSGRTNEVQQ